jgi:hypothetical protein
VVLTLDRVLNANGELLRACGYTPEEVLPVDVSPPPTNATHSGRQIIVSLPGELETDDVMAILEVAHRMADARKAAAGN